MLAENYLDYLECEVASTVAQSDDEERWVQERKLGIGGSDVGAICGVSNYGTQRTVYLTKTGQYDPEFSPEAKERMYFGHVLEPIVADEFAKRTGKIVAFAPATYRKLGLPYARANIDRLIVDEHGVPYGVLECKTAGEFMNGYWEDGELPMAYIYQLNWYLFVTGLKYGAYACLVGGNKFYYYEVFYNPELIKEMFTKVDHFWNEHVLKLVEPPLSGSDADTEFIKSKYKEPKPNSEITLTGAEELADLTIAYKAEIKRLEKALDETSNKIKDQLKEHEIGYTSDHIIKWSKRSQTRVDMDMLKLEYPEVYTACAKKSSYRVLTIKEMA